jgi:hypothetical protein
MLSEIAKRCSYEIISELEFKITVVHLRKRLVWALLFTHSLWQEGQNSVVIAVAVPQAAKMEHRSLLALVQWVSSVSDMFMSPSCSEVHEICPDSIRNASLRQ